MYPRFFAQEKVRILGMMSGTSGDGIDGVLVEFDKNGLATLLWHDSYDFTPAQFGRIQALMRSADSLEITLGNSYIAELYALACQKFFSEGKCRPDFIAAHGQTIFHQPSAITWEGIALTGTLQLLNGSLLAHRSGIPVVCNFRAADMAVGGQGAPLVPFADLFLFGKKSPRDTVVVNIGGMANITAISCQKAKAEVVCAFDTGPGNVLMDLYLQNEKLGRYDQDGRLAASGKTDLPALQAFLKDPYFQMAPPKSTGREYFNQKSLDKIINSCAAGVGHADLMSTLLDITVNSVADAIAGLKGQMKGPLEVLVAGGGALNKELMLRLAKRLSAIADTFTTDKYGVPVMAREAMAFAVLGFAFLNGLPANMPAATGATRNVTLGEFHPC